MSLNDPLSTTLSTILNADIKGKSECIVRPVSKLILSTLNILKENRYIGDYEIINKTRGGLIKVNLLGNINKCGVVKPRFSFRKDNYERFEKRYLPAKGFGLFIVTTPKGVMTHKQALSNKIGGKLVAYCYWNEKNIQYNNTNSRRNEHRNK